MGGGNSRMMLENKITTDIENNVKNHVELVNNTVQNVTQSYIDKVRNSTSQAASISNVVNISDTIVRGKDSKINIDQRARINASIVAQNRVTNNTTDATNLSTVMQSALKQAVESSMDADVSQKAVNVMEQLDQNNGGVEGVINKGFDTMNNIMGGGNTEQDVKNISETRIKNSMDNTLKMGNNIEVNFAKEFGSDTKNVCKTDNSINNIVNIERTQVLDGGEININQDAAIKSAAECFTETFNVRNISTDLSAESGMTADQAMSQLTKLKQKQDVDNQLKQTKLQKNFLDSIFGNCCGMIVVVVIVVVAGGALGGKGGSSSGSGSGGSGKYGLAAGGFGVAALFLLVILIYVLINHSNAAKKMKAKIKEVSNKFTVSNIFDIVEVDDGYQILTIDGKYQLIKSTVHPSKEFTPIINAPFYPAFARVEEDSEPVVFKFVKDEESGRYKITDKDEEYALQYDSSFAKTTVDNKRSEDNYEIIDSAFVLSGLVTTFDFVITPDPIDDEKSNSGYGIKYVHRDSEGEETGKQTELYYGTKAIYGEESSLVKEGDFKLRSVEFRRMYTDDEKEAIKEEASENGTNPTTGSN